jgi:FkbM family methyltransferase
MVVLKPARLPRYLRWRRVLADNESVRRYLALREVAPGAGGELVRVTVPALEHRPVSLRPGTSDWKVFGETFRGRFHVPPARRVAPEPRFVLDLGANIGLTTAHFATLYPRAEIVGVELDGANARLARANVEPWSDRCRIVQGAVWPTDGTVRYRLSAGAEYSAAVGPEGSEVRAVSIGTLIEGHDGAVEYLKMDIEGAERDVLRAATAWADRVRCLKVEVHGPDYTTAECVSDLAALGFTTSVARDHFGAVLAWRA